MKSTQSGTFEITRNLAGREAEIATVVRAAFERRYGTGDGEAALIAELRADGDVVLELAALQADEIVGHIMFSRMICYPPLCRLAALAPVAVRVDRQRQGIGDALIRAGLMACREAEIEAVIVVGDPAYYSRFGFDAALAAKLESAYSGPHFQALELRSGALGVVKMVAHALAFLS
jgi:putative acetyltransferase